MKRRILILVAAALFASAACHEELGIGEATGELVEVKSLTFTGVEAVDESALRGALATRPTPWLPWGEERYYDRDRFEQDLKRIEAFYENRGYPNAEVTSYDVDLTEDASAVRIHIRIDEGDPLRIVAIDLQNFDVLSEPARERLREALSIRPGQPLVYQQVVESGELAAAYLKNEGYPWAQVAVDREPRGDEAAVILTARPGQKAFFGPITVVGNYSVDDEVIRRQLAYRPGEVYRLSAVRESLRRLYALELFEFANIELVNGEETPSEVPTRVILTEGDHRRLEFSFGYGTEEKGRAEVQWRHVNFYGAARTLTAHARYSWLDRGVESTFVQPFLFSPNYSLSLQAQAWYVDEPAFNALSRGGRATVTRALGPNSSLSAYFTNQFQSSRIADEALLDPTLRDELISLGLDPTTGVQDGVLSAVGIGGRLYRVDDTLNPSRGYLASMDLEQAGSWLPGTYHYLSAVGEVRGYYTPRDRVTLAARVRYGSIYPFGPESDVPFFKRFFLGGATSLRGWGRYQIAPLSGSGLPIGGNSLFEVSGEVRTQVWGNLGAVAFVDAGNVWRDAWALNVDDLLYNVGPGLRYTTPVGAVRLDFAYQLNQLEGLRIDGELQDRRWRIHFSIGQAF